MLVVKEIYAIARPIAALPRGQGLGNCVEQKPGHFGDWSGRHWEPSLIFAHGKTKKSPNSWGFKSFNSSLDFQPAKLSGFQM